MRFALLTGVAAASLIGVAGAQAQAIYDTDVVAPAPGYIATAPGYVYTAPAPSYVVADPGPAVIAGHVDSVAGPGVFFELHSLVPGAEVSVERGGTWIAFRVTDVEEYPKDQFPTDKVYRPTPDPELRVITCGGDFDRAHGRYYDNIVVYARLV